jgi:hypothetical protein
VLNICNTPVLTGVNQQASQTVALSHSTLHISITGQVGSLSTGNSSPLDEEENEAQSLVRDSLRIGLILHRLSNGICTRANDLHAYLEANRQVTVLYFEIS